jgi:peptidyl-prolyl cis-trans isomerase D
MFEMLRKMILPIIVGVLVLFVAMIVLQWGLDVGGRGQGLDKQGSLAGIINGEEIPYPTYNQVLNNLYQAERDKYGADYEIPEDRERQLEQQAWTELVGDRLIKQEGVKMKVTVSDGDIYQYLKYNPPTFLQQSPELQTNGQFDYQKYLALMTDAQAASLWANLEPMVREDLKRMKVQQRVVEAVQVGEPEARQAFMDQFEKISVGIVNVPTIKVMSVVGEATPSELQTYYNDHRDKYTLGERVVLEIVRIAKQPSQLDQEAASVRAKEIYDSVTAGADFAEFARIFSDDLASASQGGDLGWLAKGRMGPEFDSVAFAMREGEISTPLKTQSGWHVIKNLGYREENGQREAHVAQIQVKATASAETLDAAWQQLDMVRTQAGELGFAEAAKAEGLEVYTTAPPIEKEGRVAYVGAGPQDIEWAFKGQVGDISEVLDLTSYYCVMRTADKLPSGLADFKEAETKVKRDWRNSKLTQACHDTAQAVYDDVGRGMSLSAAAERHGLTYDQPGPFARTATLLQVSSDPAAIGTAFGLPRVGAVSKPVDHANGSVIFELLDRQTPNLTTFDEKRDSVFNALTRTKQQQVYSAWFTKLSESAQIESFVNFQRRR